MKLSIDHDFLVKAPDFHSAEKQVRNFLQNTTLIRYGSVAIDKEDSVSAEHEDFWQHLERGVNENRKVVNELLDELASCGYSALKDISQLKQGFESKVLHTVTHMLDGFIGVDSVFFSLIEDSHWITPTLRKEITEHASQYWLIRVTAGDIQETLLHQGPMAGNVGE